MPSTVDGDEQFLFPSLSWAERISVHEQALILDGGMLGFDFRRK